jgi:spermidine/putrescine transport system substrate-binding protein
MRKPKTARPPCHPTAGAARAFRRRTLLKALGATCTVAAIGPWPVKDALSSSGTLSVLMWSDYFPEDFKNGFEKKTGIRIRHTGYGSNEELLQKIQSTRGRGYDLVGPTLLRAPQWYPLEILQPFDMSRVPAEKIDPRMLGLSYRDWMWPEGLYHLPFLWGTEGVSWRSDKWSSSYGELSYGDLWRPEFVGRVMGRPHSMMLGIGLYLDATGKVRSNRMLDAYKNEDSMRRIWSQITQFAVSKRDWIRLFWNDSETQKNGFLHNGVLIGQTWDGPINALQTAGEPVTYMAPKEGALGWLDGLAMPIGAKNIEQVYAFLDYFYDAKVSGKHASTTGYYPVAKGGREHMSEVHKKQFEQSFPEGAIENLWWWPSEPIWYARLRGEFRDRFITA